VHDDPQPNESPLAGAEASNGRARALGLALLAAVQRLAEALEELHRFEQRHVRQRTVLRNLYAAAANSADRIDRRISMVRELEDAAERAESRLLVAGDRRVAEARSTRRRIIDEIERLERSRIGARHTLAELERAVTEHEHDGVKLSALRTEFTRLRADSERGLALLSEAARTLAAAAPTDDPTPVHAPTPSVPLAPPPAGGRVDAPTPVAAASKDLLPPAGRPGRQPLVPT